MGRRLEVEQIKTKTLKLRILFKIPKSDGGKAQSCD